MQKGTEIRRQVLTGEISKRAACREYKRDWKILKRVLEHEEPTEYRLKQPGPKPKLERFLPMIHEILRQVKVAFFVMSLTYSDAIYCQVLPKELFDVVSTAYERTSLIVTTNLPFENWREVLGSERLTGARLDRLTHRCHILEATGESYRLQDARRRRGMGRKSNERRAPQGEDLP